MRKRTGAGREVNKTEVADLFGVSLSTVDQWLRRGLPSERREKNVVFNTAQVTQWLEAQAGERAAGGTTQAGSIDEARIRKISADAALAELQLQRERGEVVAIEEVAKEFGDACAAVRAKLLAIPTKLAPRVAIEDSEVTCRDLIEREIIEALNELVADGLREGAAREHEAASETDSEPVGGSIPAAIA